MAASVKSHYSGFYLPEGACLTKLIKVMVKKQLTEVEVGINQGRGDKRAVILIDEKEIYRAVHNEKYYRQFFNQLEGIWYGFTKDLLADDLTLGEGASLRSYSELDSIDKTPHPNTEVEAEETQKMSLGELQQRFAELAERKTDIC